jgi:hypothetical protein
VTPSLRRLLGGVEVPVDRLERVAVAVAVAVRGQQMVRQEAVVGRPRKRVLTPRRGGRAADRKRRMLGRVRAAILPPVSEAHKIGGTNRTEVRQTP